MSYNTVLVNDMIATGAAATRESNDELYPLVVAGNADAIRRMIEGNMSLVVTKVDAYIGCFPQAAYLRDDLISEGFLGLTVGVNKMAEAGEVERPNPTGYMSFWIMKYIGLVMDRQCANGASPTTIRDRKNRGEELPRSVTMGEPLDDIYKNSDEETEIQVHHVNNREMVVDPTAEIELRDLIDSCCEDENDRIIVDMREKGYVHKDIAARLELPVTTTYMLNRAIYARFLEKSGLKGEV